MLRHFICVSLFVLVGAGRAVAAESSPVDPKCVGTWELVVPDAQGGSTWTFVVKADGTYDSTAVGEAAPGGHHGSLAAMEGKWALQASNVPWKDRGTFEVTDESTMVMTGCWGSRRRRRRRL